MRNRTFRIVVVAVCLLNLMWFVSKMMFQKPCNVSKGTAQFSNRKANSTGSTFAVMGATANPIYLFPLPITVIAWKRIGIDSIVCFAGDEKSFVHSPATKIVLNFLKDLGVQWIFLNTKKAPLHTVSQTCRIYIASSPDINISDDSIVITTDSDVWMFHKENHVPKLPYKLHLYNSECCKLTSKPFNQKYRFRMYPMASIGMTAMLWRELMNVTRDFLTNGDVLAERLYAEFDNVPYIRDGKGKDSTLSLITFPT